MHRSLRHYFCFTVLFALWVAALGTACGVDDGLPAAGVDCADLSPLPAIVSDIDETLTTSDNELLLQIVEPEHVQAQRPGAVALIQGFYDRGYQILYLSARYEDLALLDGTLAREFTETWLVDQGFPMDSERTRLVLATEPNSGAETAAYKRGALEDLIAQGWDFSFAFGNADTDIQAYQEAGLAVDHTYIIGDRAGEGGTVAVAGEGWTDLITMLLDPQGRVCDF